MDRVLIVSNPESGQKKSKEIANELINIFQAKGIITHLYETKGEDDFRSLVQKQMMEGFNTVAILGGDGTISKFVNDIANFKKRPDIFLLPLGTTNNLARALRTELDLDKILNKVTQGDLTEKQIDVGKLNEQYFISTVSVGSVPEIAWKTDDDVKEKFGPFGYVLEGLQVLNEQKSFDVSIKTEAEDVILDEVFILVIGLSNSIFGIPTFFEGAQMDDGKLHLYILQHSGLLSEVGSIARHVLQNEEKAKDQDEANDLSLTTSFKTATINSSSNMNFTVDGEKGPSFPVTLEVLNKHLKFLIPLEDN